MKHSTDKLITGISRTQNKAIVVKTLSFALFILGLVALSHDNLQIIGMTLIISAIFLYLYTFFSSELTEAYLSGKLIQTLLKKPKKS